jgi:hypothetical protein
LSRLAGCHRARHRCVRTGSRDSSASEPFDEVAVPGPAQRRTPEAVALPQPDGAVTCLATASHSPASCRNRLSSPGEALIT